MDKFAEAYKATLTAFHGIISAWLFLTFSERTVDQFVFVILIIFFGVANTLVLKSSRSCGDIGRASVFRVQTIARPM